MLDQNTDRMWYVIGAIIIGGLILTSSIVLFTEVTFAGVQDTFSMFSNVLGDREYVNLNYNMDDILLWQGDDYEKSSTNKIELSTTSSGFRSGVYIDGSIFEYGKKYKVNFDMDVLSGDVFGLGGHLPFSDDVVVSVNGQSNLDYWYGNASINGGLEHKLNDWSIGVELPESKDKSYSLELLIDRNIKDEDIVRSEKGLYIQPNRTNGRTDTGATKDTWVENKLSNRVSIKNIEVYEYIGNDI